ncbi:MAG TPA: hypothetical protein ENI69_06470 [Rhodospirillales bacterium]|nr:hypothetical protein [Rhodospirillales bacterium]
MGLKKLSLLVFVILFAAALAVPSALAQSAKTKILKYDSSGRVIGVVESESRDTDSRSSGNKKNRKKAKKSSGFDPDNSYEPGEVIVVNPPKRFSSGIGGMGYRVVETVRMNNLGLVVQRIRIPAKVTVPQALRQLRSRFPGVEIDANHQFDASAGVEFPGKVARALIRWDKVPKDCGKGVRIGMIDAGVDVTHPALRGQKITYRSFHKKGRKPGPKDHGTAVAAIMVGRAEWGGLLPGAELFAANMFEINEKGRKVGSAIGLIKAASWLLDQNVHVINLSVAGADNKVLRKVFKKVLAKKQKLVAAGGNWGRSDKPAYPAAYKGVVAVTALNSRGLIYSKANTGSYIDFAAPGVRVYTAAPGGGGRLQSGTSFASPFIAAMMALDIKNGKGKSLASLEKLLKKNIKDLGAPGRDDIFGWGFVRRKPQC